MGKYIKKGLCVGAEVAPQLSITDRITDVLLDMKYRRNGPSQAQLDRLATLTAEALRQAGLGLITLVSQVSSVWDAPGQSKPQWYGRDESLWPLPGTTPRSYRVNGIRL